MRSSDMPIPLADCKRIASEKVGRDLLNYVWTPAHPNNMYLARPGGPVLTISLDHAFDLHGFGTFRFGVNDVYRYAVWEYAAAR